MRAPPLFQTSQQWPAPLPPLNAPLHVRSNTNAAKPGKTKLNLLNPMSLLARRRSSQKVAEAAQKSSNFEDLVVPALRLPDDYDPRIRGKGVHDFSAPRSARSNQSPPKSSNGQETHSNGNQWSLQSSRSAPLSREDTSSSNEKEHTPVFKENFDDDDMESWQEGREGPAKRPMSSFTYKVALQEAHREPDPSTLPAFARKLPASFLTSPEPIPRVASPPRAPLGVVPETALSDGLPKDVPALPSPPTSPPSKGRSRASSDTDSGFIPAGLPKRFKSDASRFSFDLAGVGSAAQEKLLEEKHRQKAKEKARASAESSNYRLPDDEHEDDEDPSFDDLDDDDGFEERIPGVNADAEEEDVSISLSAMPAIGVFNSAPASKTAFTNPMSPVNEGVSQTPPRDGGGLPIASATTQTSPDLSRDEGSRSSHRSSGEEPRSQRVSGTTVDTEASAEPHLCQSVKPLDATLPAQPTTAGYQDEDDMYFDDGMIEDLEDVDGQTFDESVFDDDTSRVYGLPIRDLPKQQQPHIIGGGLRNSEQLDGVMSQEQLLPAEKTGNSGDDMITDEMRDSLPDLNQSSRPAFSHTAGLTQDNLAAYHDALAMAANQAALSGKFARRSSLQSEQSIEHPGLDSDPCPVVDESPSLEVNGHPFAQNIPGSDDYDFDDVESEDAIIAAANAEALENDDEDFYGQEFGFYARKTGSGEYANGGYFGPGIGRSHSGRNVEPALTPITERSEWSNRNSAISLALHGYPSSTLPPSTPGLAQLADLMHPQEDNMSLSALMKLRRGAWGSSTTSLQSSSGTSGSPLTYHPPMASNAAALQYQQLNRSNPTLINTQNFGASTYSLNSNTSYSADDSPVSEGSHTLTLQNFAIPPCTNPAMNAPYMAPSYSNGESESSPVKSSSPVQSRPRSGLVPQKGKGHRRNASKDGESVCYVHERDEEGERWVLEKRRVGERGVVEVLGREVVEGGRI